ncbi:MAG: Crp/Fnr family transcriptional regulator [Flavobacteriaceae bacterium]|jgi:CRP-like cAMP-binding protein|nr:Crp/Fnr family transcriptional regulator [Flavobacteriaceae bacterium]
MLRTNINFVHYIESLAQTEAYTDKITLMDYKPRDILFHQGDTVTKVIVIAEGITKCFITEENGKEYIPEFLGAGEIIGEIEYLGKKPILCSIEALSNVKAYIIPLSVFQQLIQSDLKFNTTLLEIEALRVYHTSARASFQQLYTVEYALENLLALQEKEQISITKEDMASYLGITTRTLNRVLKKMHEEE